MSTNDDAKRPSAVDLLRPAVRAMPGYTPGEQISDLVKLNTNEGAFPPSPRVMAALAAIADETLRLYPDPVSARLRAAAAARFGVTAGPDPGGQRLRRLPDHPVPRRSSTRATRSPARGRPTASTTRWRRCRAPSWCGSPFRQNGRRWELPPDLARQRAKMIILANPNNPSGTLVPVDELRALCDAATGAIVVVDEAYVDFALGAGIDASMLPYLAQHPNLVVLRTMSKSYSLAGARLGLLFAAAPLVDGADQGQGQLQRQRRHAGARRRRAGGPQLPRGVRAPHAGPARAPGTRAGRRSAGRGPNRPPTSCCARSASAPRRSTARSRSEGLLVRWWRAPELRTKLRISVGNPDENDHLLAALKRLA